MADLEQGLFTYLSTWPDLAALVGSRIYPLVLPQAAALPAVVYQRISTPPVVMAHSGPAGLASARVQLTAWGSSYTQVRPIAAALRAALDGLKGVVGSVEVAEAYVDNEMDHYDPESLLTGVVLDVIFLYQS